MNDGLEFDLVFNTDEENKEKIINTFDNHSMLFDINYDCELEHEGTKFEIVNIPYAYTIIDKYVKQFNDIVKQIVENKDYEKYLCNKVDFQRYIKEKNNDNN